MSIKYMAVAVCLLAGCTSYSAKQPYRAVGGEQVLISGNIINGTLKLWVNDALIFDEPFIHQDRSLPSLFNGSFVNVYNGKYKDKAVMARCSSKQNTFTGPDRECDVFINGEHAANLFFR